MIGLSRRPAPTDATLKARVDLRSGAVCAGVVRWSQDAPLGVQTMTDLLTGACDRWRRLFATPALSVSLPFGTLLEAGAALDLDAAFSAAGFAPHLVTLEIDENEFLTGAGALAAAERLRGRGWGLALRGGDRPQLAIDARARNLFRELVQPRCTPVSQFLQAEGPLVRRIDAAKAAGMLVCVERLPPDTPPAWLLAAGIDRFDRHCGPA